MSQVLGISVTDVEIASVVAESGTGDILARNFVELPGTGPDVAFDAIYQLIESAPTEPAAITIACSDSGMQLAIADIIAAGVVPDFLAPPDPTGSTSERKPSWFARTTVVGTPVAFAEIAAGPFGSPQSEARGVVAVAALDTSGALFPGQSVALVDTATRTVVGASAVSPLGDRLAVTEPDGAQTLADAIGVIGNPAGGLFGLLVIGPGAQIPGVAPSLEYALQLPVQIAEDPQYTAAHGAALVAAAAAGGRGDNSRWVLLSAAAGAALLLAVGVIVAVVMTGGNNTPETAVDENPVSTVSASSSTTTAVSTSKGQSRISSPTVLPPPPTTTTTLAPPPPPPTRTITQVPPPVTVTQAPPPVTTTTPPTTTTTTTTSPPVSPSESEDADDTE
ncbi:hypothetical protein BH683_004035 [Williamsia sp. 1138]|uniref:hypothetical protein n=1 Tax=Williamsia sp. 1138 TaxID=1903117 RepID=UPI000A114AB0|nr:hypothetical protein [Williamsia sp. 1138]OZG30447.1 hypothetical protein BH683_004035 [Williamsia sp. 1138]